jgi:hypothetical protein
VFAAAIAIFTGSGSPHGAASGSNQPFADLWFDTANGRNAPEAVVFGITRDAFGRSSRATARTTEGRDEAGRTGK